MNHSFWRRGGRLWVQGAALLLLRLWQNRAGFDPATGLTVPSVPGKLFPLCLLLFAALELLLVRRLPGQKASYAGRFDPPGGFLLPAAVTGCFALAAGGVLLAAEALPARALVAAAAGVLAAAGGPGLLVLLRRARSGEEPSLLPALPAMVFGVFFVLAVYVPSESDPVLPRIAVPILAASLSALAFSALGGFLRGDARPRTFALTADLAVLLCLAAAADGGLPRALLYAGCALTLTVFRLLLREDPAEKTAQP